MNERMPLPDIANLPFVEELYQQFVQDPASVSQAWRSYFEGLGHNGDVRPAGPRSPSRPPKPLFDPDRGHLGQIAGMSARCADTFAQQQDHVTQLVLAYLTRGHLAATLDPLGQPRPAHPDLETAFYGFTEKDLDRRFATLGMPGDAVLSLREILERLRMTYCRSIGAQFMHLDDPQRRAWIRARMEGTESRLPLTSTEQLRILTRLTDAVIFEEFIQQKYPGAKSFSLEGAESLIPLLDLVIETAGAQGIENIVLAMGHRGRLNVLANILGKRPREIFHEFDDPVDPLRDGRGDVKYHLGHSSDWVTALGHRIHLSLCFNPSHLEFVNPVALGRIRAKQDRIADAARRRGMAVLIHGDASFVGQGIVQETLNLSELDGYRTGGALHVIVNNQIGFTTPTKDARSSVYATDVALMLQIPIFHVNGEDAEAVAHVVRLAMEYRRTFQSDVVLDMYCFRRRGHNEGDEPAFTQPLRYELIDRRPPLRESYLDHLLRLGKVDRTEADRIAVERRQVLERDLAEARGHTYLPVREKPAGIWTGYYGGFGGDDEEIRTAVECSQLVALLERLTRLPEGFHPHRKIAQWLERRREMASGTRPIDWATAEALAFATLAVEGHRIRLSGQDSPRGTFSHRHAVLYDTQDAHTYVPLQHVAPDQAPVEIYNSPLSEAGALGFEYGYSLDCPGGLILWEAQFGDFVNAGQVIIDQFLVSAEEKWRRLSGLVLLLPHGLEGQGPEHSSARLERFLELAANENIHVSIPTTPAQYFHILRRQVHRPWRKPLVIMGPKSLLRHPKAISTLEDLATGTFQPILVDQATAPEHARRVLLCSGKVYYQLLEMRDELQRADVAIVRLEQLYPLHEENLRHALLPYPSTTPVTWVQEEPANMGAWRYLHARFGDTLFHTMPFSAVCRPVSASPATGWSTLHKTEEIKLLKAAFDAH